MRGSARRAVTLLMAGAVSMSLAVPASASGDRALWVWDQPSQAIVDFSVSNGVSDVYLHAPPGFSADPAFDSFLASAHGSGLAVHAMAGDPGWAKDPGPWTMWTREVATHGGFDGIVFDVEPYGHPDWNSRKQSRLINSYLSGLDAAVRAAGELPALAAVPFWFDEIRVKRDTLLQRVVGSADGIVVMAYRDQAAGADGIIALSQTEAVLASAAGKLFVIGVETAAVVPEKVTFHEEGRAEMETELAAVETHFGAMSGYGGIAIHHYASYSAMAN